MNAQWMPKNKGHLEAFSERMIDFRGRAMAQV
jgi:hypothetical protein